MDPLTPAQRSERMSRVRSSGNASTELRLIQLFRQHGITGWRRKVPLPGRPDFVFRAARLAVFVDGCFWHGCPKHKRLPKSRPDFWAPKLERNRQRDREVNRTLRGKGWTVVRIWECSLRTDRSIKALKKRLDGPPLERLTTR